MAYTNGTAANYKDLLAAMVTFASANGWVVLEQSETKVYLKGTGLAGLDEIYVGAETYENPTSGIYNWYLYGSWGYRAGKAFNAMPRTSAATGDTPIGCFWNAAIPYWMVANPRRIIVVAKVGSVYTMVHLGLLTPPATDAQYPYPLLVAGVTRTASYGYASTNIANIWSTANANSYGGGRLHTPGGAWAVNGTNAAETEIRPCFGPRSVCAMYDGTILTGLDGSYLLEPVYMESKAVAIYGHMEGVFRVTGYQMASENIITVDGVNYMAFQDCSRNGFFDFCALRMN